MSFSLEHTNVGPGDENPKEEPFGSEVLSETRPEKLRREYEESVKKEAKRRDDLFKEAINIERHTDPAEIIEENARAEDKKVDRLIRATSRQQIVNELDSSFEEQVKRETLAKQDAEQLAKLHRDNQFRLGKSLPARKDTIGSIVKRFFSK